MTARLVCCVCNSTATHAKVLTFKARTRGKVTGLTREARHYCDPHAPHGSVKLIAR